MDEEHFKLKRFRHDDTGFVQIRSELLNSGKRIAFGIAGTDLSVLQFSSPIDFDALSDEIIAQNQDSVVNRAYQYEPSLGFSEVGISEQTWFKF